MAGPFRKLARRVPRFTRGPTNLLFFDEVAYRRENADVGQAVQAGMLRSGYDHYLRYGRWEGRVFPVRAFGLPNAVAARACALSADVERTVRRLRAEATFGEVGHRLESENGDQVVPLAGPWTVPADHGPWRARLPGWVGRGGFFMLEVAADCPPGGAPFAFQACREDGGALGPAAAAQCKADRTTRRLLRLSSGARQIEVQALDERLRARPRTVRLKPVPMRFARSRILRRLAHHHPDYVSLGQREVLARVREKAEGRENDLMDALWREYTATFPPAVARPDYHYWIEHVEGPELEQLDRKAPERLAKLERRPLVSVLVPTFATDEMALRMCLDSVTGQSYPDWELCIADDASPGDRTQKILQEYASQDRRIRVAFRQENGHICAASNDALALAQGEYVALLDHDDLLCRHALLQVVEAINANPRAQVMYSDEDKIRVSGYREQPHFKPEFDPDLLLGQNYVGHLLVAKTERVRGVGGFRVGFEGSQDHDLLLRLTERLGREQVVHLPNILYHWRMSEESTAESARAKPYTLDSGLRAVREALARRGDVAQVEHSVVANVYAVSRRLPDPAPRVSIIVPTRDCAHLLRTCVASVLKNIDYPNFELLLVDNGTVDPDALAGLEQLRQDDRVRLLRYDRPFNFSALNNFAARHAEGELLCLLNNDIEVKDPSWLTKLVVNAVRPEIGCVGTKLQYPDGTIQHAGVVLGLHGLAGHSYRHMDAAHHGYYGRLRAVHSVSAVTAACLVVRKSVYQEVDGLDADALAVAFNDVDFCLKVSDAGYRNLLVPDVELIHHESASRGSDQDEDKRARFDTEIATMKRRWGKRLFEDPYYSPHLSLDHNDYSIRIPS